MFLVSRNNSFLVIVLFKTILPMFVGNFYCFACYKWAGLKLGLLNSEKNDGSKTTVKGSDKKRN